MRKAGTFAFKETKHAALPLAECALARAIAVIGDPWSLLIIRELIYGVDRFTDFCDDLSIPRSVLTDRLEKLIDHGVIEKVAYREKGARARFAYQLTDKGYALYPAIIALREWAAEHLPGEPSRLVMGHSKCSGRLMTKLVCEHGHEVRSGRDVAIKIPR